jgi:hydroxyacylglutathione hydrolase
MLFEQVRVGGDRNFAYLAGDSESRTALVVDPSYSPESVLAAAGRLGLTVAMVINTHGHPDHTNGNDFFAARGVPVAAHPESPIATDAALRDGQILPFGALSAKIIHTPGHSPDSLCVLIGNRLLTGDTLFVGKIGGTDLGSGAREEHDSLWRKILPLPDETEVWPGHDYGVRPSSTIGIERRTNPFLLCATFEEFLHLKQNWAEYKRIHGIR